MVFFSPICIAAAGFLVTTSSAQQNGPLRGRAERLRHPDSSTLQSPSLSGLLPNDGGKMLKSMAADPTAAIQELVQEKDVVSAEANRKQSEIDSLLAALEVAQFRQVFMSMTAGPTDSPTAGPTVSMQPSDIPSLAPSPVIRILTPEPTVAVPATSVPTISTQPSSPPSPLPTSDPTTTPGTAAPTAAPQVVVPADLDITLDPTSTPVAPPPPFATAAPTVPPTAFTTAAPVTPTPTNTPTVPGCGISAQERTIRILAVLDAVADPAVIRNNDSPQGLATTWLINEDGLQVCPDDPKIVQRWALAVTYYSTGGDAWFQCSASPNAIDDCGAVAPFSEQQDRFLAASNECSWAGISCLDGCVTEIEFEENNLVGTIPTEITLLSDLAIWGMERGGLTGTIPTEIEKLTSLIFLDLDFNALTGTISTQLLSLSALTQLDLNNNNMTGSINGIGVFPDMEFLQLHDNAFTGTVPEAIGSFAKLDTFTLHENGISGTMPESVCELLASRNGTGVLRSLISDCDEPNPDIVCTCCTDCRST